MLKVLEVLGVLEVLNAPVALAKEPIPPDGEQGAAKNRKHEPDQHVLTVRCDHIRHNALQC